MFQLRVSYEFIVNVVHITQTIFTKTFSHLMAQERSVDQELGVIKQLEAAKGTTRSEQN